MGISSQKPPVNTHKHTLFHACSLPSPLSSGHWKLYEQEPAGYSEIADKIQRDGILQILKKELGALANGNLKYVPLLLRLYWRKKVINNLPRTYIPTEHITLKLSAHRPPFFKHYDIAGIIWDHMDLPGTFNHLANSRTGLCHFSYWNKEADWH